MAPSVELPDASAFRQPYSPCPLISFSVSDNLPLQGDDIRVILRMTGPFVGQIRFVYEGVVFANFQEEKALHLLPSPSVRTGVAATAIRDRASAVPLDRGHAECFALEIAVRISISTLL